MAVHLYVCTVFRAMIRAASQQGRQARVGRDTSQMGQLVYPSHVNARRCQRHWREQKSMFEATIMAHEVRGEFALKTTQQQREQIVHRCGDHKRLEATSVPDSPDFFVV